jgi:hypothetical protein
MFTRRYMEISFFGRPSLRSLLLAKDSWWFCQENWINRLRTCHDYSVLACSLETPGSPDGARGYLLWAAWMGSIGAVSLSGRFMVITFITKTTWWYLLIYYNMPICCLMINPCARHIQLHVYIIYIYAFVHMYVYIYIHMHMFSTCIDFIPMCIYVYLFVYFVHVLTTAYIERVQQRTTGGPSAGHQGTVQVYFEGRNLERLRPLSGLDGSPFRRLGCFF